MSGNRARKPKFKVGQVVSVWSFYGNFEPGEDGPGFEGGKGWRHGWAFGKIVRVLPPDLQMKRNAPYCYFLDNWPSALVEKDLKRLTKREASL